MAIVALKKLTFCGLSSEKLQILEALQTVGCAHLIALKKNLAATVFASSLNSEKALTALNYLNQSTIKRHQRHDDGAFDMGRVVEDVLAIHLKSRELADKRDTLIKRIKEIESWGDFSLPKEEALQGLKLWFYRVPERLMQSMQSVKLAWQQVHQDNLYRYIVVVDSREPSLSDMPVPRSHIGKIPLSQLKSELNELELALEDLGAEREALTRWIGLIAAHLAKADDDSELKLADSISIDSEGVFIVQAWVPKTRLADCESLSRQHHLALLCADPDVDERPPTLLQNPEHLAGGEELVNFYYPPAYDGWDPSIVVFFSFAVFFSMILSDAGYAGLFGLLLGIVWRKLGRSKKGLRLRRLAMTTIFLSMIWGALAGSYFGVSPVSGGVLHALKLIDITDFDAMMQLSIAVGVAHIAMANAVMFYQRRGSRFAFAFLGWCAVAIGGFLFWWSITLKNDLLMWIAYGLLGSGGLLILIFSSERTIVKPLDWLWRILEGCNSLTGMTGLFGDVLSYMRLFALGLSSASLALVFNQLAGQVYHSVEGLGLFLSLLILLLGHALNLVLCFMGGLVHGLRLNFIEFYHWGVSGEGYPFKAFSKKGVY
jgi:V/A-type H+-transporting ATPase subunit I